MASHDVPLESVELHGRRLTYRRMGDGPVLLLVHGITNSSASWQPVMRLLADAGHTVLAPDLPGHGGSERRRLRRRAGSWEPWPRG